MLTWYRLLTGGCHVAIWYNIVCITAVITPSNPRTDMIQWHLFNKWGAIFTEVPPLKYLKLVTLYVHAGMYKAVSWKTFRHRGKKWKDLSQWMIQRTVIGQLKGFRVGSTGDLSQCDLLITRYWHNSEIIPTRCNNCVYSSQWLYSTCFGWQFHPSSGVQCCIWLLR